MSGGGGGYEGYNRAWIDRAGQAEAYDAIGERYDEVFPSKEGQLASAAWLAESLPPHSRILDVGCGTGVPTARQLVEAGHRVVGIDISPVMVRLARDNVPQAEFHRLDLADLDRRKLGPFDGVVAYFSLLNLPRQEIPFALRTLHAQLREDGLMAMSMVEADVNDYPFSFLGNSIRVSGYLREELRQVVQEAGFEIVGEEAHAYAPASTELPPEIQLFLNCRRRA